MRKHHYFRRSRLFYLPFILGFLLILYLVFLQLSAPSPGLWESIVSVGTSLIFFGLGAGIFYHLAPRIGMIPLLAFHFLGSLALPISVRLTQSSFALVLGIVALSLMPATLLQFGRSIAHTLVDVTLSLRTLMISYAGFALLGFALIVAKHQYAVPANDIFLVLLGFLVFCIALWNAYLLWLSRTPQPELEKLLPRYLLYSQLLAFWLPIAVACAIWIWFGTLPWLLLIALFCLFPISIWLGVLPAERQQLQTYIVQSEKRVAFGDLLAGLSHELNNPLTFVQSSLEPLQESLNHIKGVLTHPDQKTTQVMQQLDKMVKNMEDGMNRAQALLESFRSMPSGRRPVREELKLPELIERCIELLAHRWRDRVEIDRDYEGEPVVRGVASELEQVFTNLIGNAIDASPEGGCVTVSVSQAAAGVKVEIKDCGQGIPRDMIGKIFDPFFTTKPQGKGQGLGLAISLQIVKQHGGSIEVKSQPGRGAEFIVFFPH